MQENFERAKTLFLEGVEHLEAGRLSDAEERFLSSLALVPGRASTLTNLGATRIRLGKPREALDVLAQVLVAEPYNNEAWFHRGTALESLGQYDEALACFDKVLATDSPLQAACLYLRGTTLNKLQRPAEAVSCFERFLALHPNHAWGWLFHGQALQELRRTEQALRSYEKSVAIDPTLARAWSQRGAILKDTQRLDEAATCFRQALAHGGDQELNSYLLASVAGEHAPARAPAQYVRALFDTYADQFDEHLVKQLNYRGHVTLVENLQHLGERRFHAALDLGCGTGLCGEQLKPLVDRLDGIDLSERMIEKARARGIYDELVRAEISEHLASTQRRYDLVACADAVIYIGDLAPVFRGAADVMNAGGVFCLSAELAPDSADYELRSSSRYAHSERYLRRLAEAHGFDIAHMLQRPIREDQKRPIAGLYLYLTKR